MTKRTAQASANFANAHLVRLPECEATADAIVQLLVEGYHDGFSSRSQRRKVEHRKEAA